MYEQSLTEKVQLGPLLRNTTLHVEYQDWHKSNAPYIFSVTLCGIYMWCFLIFCKHPFNCLQNQGHLCTFIDCEWDAVFQHIDKEVKIISRRATCELWNDYEKTITALCSSVGICRTHRMQALVLPRYFHPGDWEKKDMAAHDSCMLEYSVSFTVNESA